MKLAFVVALVLASALVACSGSGSDSNDTPTPSATAEPAAEIPVVEITKTEEGFEAPDSIPGGLARFRVHNAATVPHAVTFQRFRGEGTLEELDAAYNRATDFAASAAAIERLTTVEGGTGSIAPGGDAEVVLDLVPGRYAIVRFPLGTQLRELEVTAAPDVRPTPPESAFTVRMVEFAFEGFPGKGVTVGRDLKAFGSATS